MLDPGHGKQLADLLEADLCLSTRNHSAYSLPTFDAPAFTCHPVGYSQSHKQLGGDVVAAYAGGIRDGSRLQKRAFQRVDRTDVRLRRSCPHGHTDS